MTKYRVRAKIEYINEYLIEAENTGEAIDKFDAGEGELINSKVFDKERVFLNIDYFNKQHSFRLEGRKANKPDVHGELVRLQTSLQDKADFGCDVEQTLEDAGNAG